jgi:hypothetical protein
VIYSFSQRSSRPASVFIPVARLCALYLVAQGVSAQINFEDVTLAAGITYAGESYGASWGDLNSDGWPDLFVNHHRSQPSLLVNLGNNRFEDRWYEVDRWRAFPGLDQHGASWNDFDNDGDQDLFVSLGRRDISQFLVNNGQVLTDQTVAYGLGLFRTEGRLPVWFDYNHDGILDWGMADRGGRFLLFSQIADQLPSQTFSRDKVTGQTCEKNQYVQLADLDNDGTLDLVCDSQEMFPSRVYNFGTTPFADITSILPPVPVVNDSIVADIDGNLQTDIILLRGFQRLTGAEITGSNNTGIQANITTTAVKEKGINFVTEGDLSFSLSWNARNASAIKIGSSGYSLAPQPGGGPLLWTLSAADPANWGIQPHDPTTDTGFYIGFDPASQRWTVLLSPGNMRNTSYMFIDSTSPISSLNVTGRQFGDMPIAPVVYLNNNGVFTDQAANVGLNTKQTCVSGAAGDFDNDMDLDLYLVCRGAINNQANQLLENQGDGTFKPLVSSGAEGPVGLGVGLGENVVVADYDRDGFLDLFVTNGLSMYPEDALTTGGPDKLFRNRGNGNHWVELDLLGTFASRDAVGAKVYITAGGVTQLREQSGGYHRWAQHHQRLHAGLGTNHTVNIEVRWPSPSTHIDKITNLPADKIYRITEGGAVDEVTPVGPVPPSPCVAPTFDKSTETGAFLWKDCNSGIWSLRASPGGQTLTFAGNVRADRGFDSLTGVVLEDSDILEYASDDPQLINYALEVAGKGVDGFDFSYPSGSQTCFDMQAPNGMPVYVGRSRSPVTPPFDLTTMAACAPPRPLITVTGVTVAENDASGVARLDIKLSKASTSSVEVTVATADGAATAPGDYTALPPTTITFAPGETSRQLEVAIKNDKLLESPETFTVFLTNPVNSNLSKATATVTIIDDEPSPCGKPVYDKSTERGIFLWKSCGGGGWKLRTTTGSGSDTYEGTLTSDQNFLSVIGFNLEFTDTLSVTSSPARISYRFTGVPSSQDGIDFSFPVGANVCVPVGNPESFPVYLGASRAVMAAPFNLETQDSCVPL